MQVHDKKAHLLKDIDNSENPPKLLIDFLNNQGFHKYTYFNTHKDLFKNISSFTYDDEYCIFEMALDSVKRKPYLDMEEIYPDKKICIKKYKFLIPKLQRDIIKVFKEQYNETITTKDILILNSSGQTPKGYKMSFHIIVSPRDRTLYYVNSKYTNSSAYHLYTSLINLDQEYKDVLDAQVYNTDITFRIIESAKATSDSRILRPIDPETFKPIDTTISEKLHYFLTYIRKENKMLKTPILEQTTKPKKCISSDKPPTTQIQNNILQLVKKLHPSATFHGFYKDTFYNFNYTDRKEECPISGKIHDGTNGFYVYETARGYYMKCHSSKCTEAKHIGCVEIEDDFINNGHQINQPYLIMDGDLGKKPKEEVKTLIKDWLDSDKHKLLVVKSAMATGKTTMIKKILKYDDSLEKILWITHRQTLTNEIYGKFRSDEFYNYMDHKGSLSNKKRLIVQIDSLERIKEYEKNGYISMNKYDLVIIDEIEGNLHHYSSPFLDKGDKRARDVFGFMLFNLKNARKVLLLDADVGTRTRLLAEHLGSPILINNNFRPIEKTFVITNDTFKFEKDIMTDIEAGKNLCIVSMTASYIEKLSVILKSKNIKHLMHTSHTDDRLKKKLIDVNKHWVKYSVILYSPCLESGVDFNEDHFDKIYCVLKNGPSTCSQRAFLQMVGRVRIVKDTRIKCLYSGPTNLDGNIFTYDDVLSYIRHYELLNGKKIIQNIAYDEAIEQKNGRIILKRKTSDISLFDNICIYNEVENLNKRHDVFMTVLNRLIQISGHKLEFKVVEKPTKSKYKDKLSLKNRIILVDETKYDFRELLQKQSDNKLDETEKLALKKFFLIRTFGIVNMEKKKSVIKFLKDFYDKEMQFKKFVDFFGYKKNDRIVPADINYSTDESSVDNEPNDKSTASDNIDVDYSTDDSDFSDDSSVDNEPGERSTDSDNIDIDYSTDDSDSSDDSSINNESGERSTDSININIDYNTDDADSSDESGEGSIDSNNINIDYSTDDSDSSDDSSTNNESGKRSVNIDSSIEFDSVHSDDPSISITFSDSDELDNKSSNAKNNNKSNHKSNNKSTKSNNNISFKCVSVHNNSSKNDIFLDIDSLQSNTSSDKDTTSDSNSSSNNNTSSDSNSSSNNDTSTDGDTSPDNEIPIIDNPPPIDGIDNDNYDSLTTAKKELRKKIVVDILNRLLGLNKQDYASDDLIDITLTGDQYKKAMMDISDNSLYFVNESKNRSLFFKSKGKFRPISKKNKHHYASTVKTLLDLFGIELARGKRVSKNKKLSYMYSLSVNKQIKKIADFKYRKTNNIDIFPDIFENNN